MFKLLTRQLFRVNREDVTVSRRYSRVTAVEQLWIVGLGVPIKCSRLCSGRVAGEKPSPVSVPHPVVIHVDPAVQMSHAPASSCSEFAFKGLMGARQ